MILSIKIIDFHAKIQTFFQTDKKCQCFSTIGGAQRGRQWNTRQRERRQFAVPSFGKEGLGVVATNKVRLIKIFCE
jgi:hypothetical protein